MITLVLISLMSLGVFAGLRQISYAMMAVALRDEAYHLVQAKAEQLLASDYSSFTSAGNETITSSVKPSFAPILYSQFQLGSDNAKGRATFTRRVVDVASTTSSKTLRVDVSWTWQGRSNVVSAPLFRTP